MKHISVVTLKSELDKYKDEVTFTIRKISHGLRMKVRNQMTKAVEEIQELTENLFAIPEFAAANKAIDEDEPVSGPQAEGVKLVDNESEEAGTAQDQLESLTKAAYKATWIREKTEAIQKRCVDPIYLKECLVAVRGITYDRNEDETEALDFDAASLLEYGPEDLCTEIIERIKLEFGITPLQVLDLESGSISGAVEDGAKNDSNVVTAGQGDSTKPEIAESTTQS